MLPTVEKLAEEYNDEVNIVKINIDDQRAIAQNLMSKAFQHFFFLEGNKIKESVKGLTSERILRKKIDALLNLLK